MKFAQSLQRATAVIFTAAMLGGCSFFEDPLSKTLPERPKFTAPTASQEQLRTLPSPNSRVAVAVYSFSDQTGQFKPSPSVQTLSRAVTQGATSILIAALSDAGRGNWFTVIERERLDNLMKERQIIREMRRSYLGEEQVNTQALPPLLFAGILLEGGVIGYDTNTITGGAGARYLGIGADTKYQQDTVTVYLRAVSVKTGEVLTSVLANKTIASYALQANAFRFVGFKDLLEAETGITYNEPAQMALRQAVEKAVYALIFEGNELGLWAFQNPAAASAVVDAYRREKLGLASDDPLPPAPAPRFATQRPPQSAAAPSAPPSKQTAQAQQAATPLRGPVLAAAGQAGGAASKPAREVQATGFPAKVTAPKAVPAGPPPAPPREVIRLNGHEYTPAATAAGDDIDWNERIIIEGREWVLIKSKRPET